MLAPADQDELVQLEESMWRAETRYNPAFQERYFAADFTEFGRSGRTYSREQIIRTGGGDIAAQLPLDKLAFRILDTNTVQLTYYSHVVFNGITEHAHRSSIWSKTRQGWVMRFHQGTPFDR